MSKLRTTMADIAQVANVSKMTVSRVLNNKPGVADETRQRILEVVNELGYSLQSTLPMSGPHIIAVLIPKHPTVYLGELLNGISKAAEQLGCGLMLYTQAMFSQAAEPNNKLSPLQTGLVDGAIIIVPPDFEEVVNKLNQCELPYVVVDHHSEAPNEASVTATNRKGMLEATRYLLALGHRRIGFIAGRMDIPARMSACKVIRLALKKSAYNLNRIWSARVIICNPLASVMPRLCSIWTIHPLRCLFPMT